MAWRETLLRHIGPGFLGGITFGKWVQLLRENHFAVAPSCLPRALAISCQSVQNSLFHWNDRRQLGMELNDVAVPPPLFLLGHWRHGTTHLHNLLTVDRRFAFANNYQALYPFSFLTAERLHSQVIDFFLPKRRPMDNVQWNMWSPQEDEFALCVSSFKSPCMSWAFPERREHWMGSQFRECRGLVLSRNGPAV
jgi:omega-hydroxy-beta-dihydromenaquinone-9 sulfotransferase